MGNNISYLVNAVVDERSRRGHSFSQITVSDQARVHNGDTYEIRNFYSASIPLPETLPSGSTCTLNPEEKALVRKRKRASDDDEGDMMSSRRERSQLDMAISHLGELAFSMKNQKQDDDAQRVIQWIRVLLDAIENGDLESSSQHTGDELAVLQKNLLRADHVMVNSTPSARRRASSQVMKTTRKCSILKLGSCQIRLDTTTCKWLDGGGRDVVDSSSSLRLDSLSSRSGKGLSVAALFGEKTEYSQRTVMHPTILAHRTISDKSEIFILIRRDDLDGVKRLLIEQKATVRDCDQDGRSLLHYASFAGSLKCCKLLVDAGVDIDRMNKDFIFDPWIHWTPLHAAVSQMRDHSGSKLQDLMACARLMIGAGADSTMRDTTCALLDSVSAMEEVCDLVTLRYQEDDFEMIFDLLFEGAVDDPRTMVSSHGRSLWLEACSHAKPAFLRKLLKLGCDATETECCVGKNYNPRDYGGWNGLFFIVMFAEDPSMSNAFESLRILLDASVNPFTRDDTGRTLFDHVKETEYGRSFKRDLWYCALHRVGINATSYSEHYPRIPRYIKSYTPKHYRALCYLDQWNEQNFDEQVDRVLENHPLSEEETEVQSSCGLEKAADDRRSEEQWRRRKAWSGQSRIDGRSENDGLSDVSYVMYWEEQRRRTKWEYHKYGPQMWFQHRTLEEYLELDREWEEEGVAWANEEEKRQRKIEEVDSDEKVYSDEAISSDEDVEMSN
ncbi:hypothetical protein Q7P37_007503 [Cladosporium fusiforme]